MAHMFLNVPDFVARQVTLLPKAFTASPLQPEFLLEARGLNVNDPTIKIATSSPKNQQPAERVSAAGLAGRPLSISPTGDWLLQVDSGELGPFGFREAVTELLRHRNEPMVMRSQASGRLLQKEAVLHSFLCFAEDLEEQTLNESKRPLTHATTLDACLSRTQSFSLHRGDDYDPENPKREGLTAPTLPTITEVGPNLSSESPLNFDRVFALCEGAAAFLAKIRQDNQKVFESQTRSKGGPSLHFRAAHASEIREHPSQSRRSAFAGTPKSPSLNAQDEQSFASYCPSFAHSNFSRQGSSQIKPADKKKKRSRKRGKASQNSKGPVDLGITPTGQASFEQPNEQHPAYWASSASCRTGLGFNRPQPHSSGSFNPYINNYFEMHTPEYQRPLSDLGRLNPYQPNWAPTMLQRAPQEEALARPRRRLDIPPQKNGEFSLK